MIPYLVRAGFLLMVFQAAVLSFCSTAQAYAFDIDGDGEPEVIVEDSSCFPIGAHVPTDTDVDGDVDLVRVCTQGAISSAPSDIDHDGEMEIVLLNPNCFPAGNSVLYKVDGAPDNDYDIVVICVQGSSRGADVDIDGDGEMEISLCGPVPTDRDLDGDGDRDLVVGPCPPVGGAVPAVSSWLGTALSLLILGVGWHSIRRLRHAV